MTLLLQLKPWIKRGMAIVDNLASSFLDYGQPLTAAPELNPHD
jgi:hypothetical protein